MKKILLSSMLIFTSTALIQSNIYESEAASISKTNLNYTSKSVIKKIKDGTVTYDGVRLGTKVSTLLKNKDYKYNEFYNYYSLIGSNDTMFMDFQENFQIANRKINRIKDDKVLNNHYYSRSKMLKAYKKPLVTKKIKNEISGNDSIYYIDFYKNATFIYGYDTVRKSYLSEVHFKKYQNKTEFKKWQNFVLDNINKQSGFLWHFSSIKVNTWDNY